MIIASQRLNNRQEAFSQYLPKKLFYFVNIFMRLSSNTLQAFSLRGTDLYRCVLCRAARWVFRRDGDSQTIRRILYRRNARTRTRKLYRKFSCISRRPCACTA